MNTRALMEMSSTRAAACYWASRLASFGLNQAGSFILFGAGAFMVLSHWADGRQDRIMGMAFIIFSTVLYDRHAKVKLIAKLASPDVLGENFNVAPGRRRRFLMNAWTIFFLLFGLFFLALTVMSPIR